VCVCVKSCGQVATTSLGENNASETYGRDSRGGMMRGRATAGPNYMVNTDGHPEKKNHDDRILHITFKHMYIYTKNTLYWDSFFIRSPPLPKFWLIFVIFLV